AGAVHDRGRPTDAVDEAETKADRGALPASDRGNVRELRAKIGVRVVSETLQPVGSRFFQGIGKLKRTSSPNRSYHRHNIYQEVQTSARSCRLVHIQAFAKASRDVRRRETCLNG